MHILHYNILFYTVHIRGDIIVFVYNVIICSLAFWLCLFHTHLICFFVSYVCMYYVK